MPRRRGSGHPTAKLTDADVRLIREGYAERTRLLREANKLTIAELAGKFEVNPRTVRDIIYGETWKHLPVLTTPEDAQCSGVPKVRTNK